MPQNEPFLTVANALLDESKPFPARYLHRFSDMEPDDLKKLHKTWPEVSTRRKHTLLEDLEDLSETDTLTNFEDLARSLLPDPDPEVRTRAIRLLFESEDQKLIPIFLNMLTNDEAVEVQAAAANALGQFVYLGELEKIPAELHHKIENQLLEVFAASKISIRRRALESLGYSGRKVVTPLIEEAYESKGPQWVVSALNAMGRSSDDRWKKQVLSQLRSPDEDIRSEAIHTSGELELRSAATTLLDLINDEEDPEIRREIIWALSMIGGEGVRAKLEEIFEIGEDDEEADFIEEALDTLSFTEDMGNFALIDVDDDVDFIEEDTNEEE